MLGRTRCRQPSERTKKVILGELTREKMQIAKSLKTPNRWPLPSWGIPHFPRDFTVQMLTNSRYFV